ncbi:c-type cytochrome [Novosphingobium sp. FSY-8]|uniref:C-type cytochrome n=1 Tax=Novosphingobium ovatum TaxID=1908523 RepID=A0ABW9XGQ9_9SPHN|nr:cytochrome c [Novosphingobium ovatum]NBC37740.1 c-type cytochrome [Novosphingobium ovatum]
MKRLILIAGLVATAPAQAAPAKPAPQLVADGLRLYTYHCAPCHGEGPGHPGTAALQRKYDGQMPALLADRRDLDGDMLRYFIRNGVNAMPYFRKTEISDAQIAAIAAYLARPRK